MEIDDHALLYLLSLHVKLAGILKRCLLNFSGKLRWKSIPGIAHLIPFL